MTMVPTRQGRTITKTTPAVDYDWQFDLERTDEGLKRFATAYDEHVKFLRGRCELGDFHWKVEDTVRDVAVGSKDPKYKELVVHDSIINNQYHVRVIYKGTHIEAAHIHKDL